MFCIPRLYEVGRCSDSYDMVGMSNSPTTNPSLSPRSMGEAITHKEAERRRRKRINAHIATLKSILPNTIKTDKASLLGEAVRRVKELKRTVAAVEEGWAPSGTDEVKVWRCDNTGLIKAAVSCDDRAELIGEMIEALKAAEAKVLRAEMSTVGGRTKTLLWLTINDVALDKLTRALKMLMDQFPPNKRSRYYHF